MIFEKIRTVPTADELVDKAFSRAVRAGRGKMGTEHSDKREIEESMVLTAGNILADNLRNSAREWPSFDRLPMFYRELADILAGIENIKMALSSVAWASDKTKDISRKYVGMIRKGPDPVALRKQAYARMASIVQDIDKDLRFLNDTRNKLRQLPEVKDEPTIVVAGYPNVGKSSFVASITGARPEIAPYPFTTKGIIIGHFIYKRKRYQVIDTPGLLDRPLEERNDIERQAISALRHVGDALLFIIDPSESCGYTVKEQQKLLEETKETVNIPVLVVANKIDVEHVNVSSDMRMSTKTGEGVQEAKAHLIEMVKENVKRKEMEEESLQSVEFEAQEPPLPPSRKKK